MATNQRLLPLTVGGTDVHSLLGISERMWRKLHAAGQVPDPVHLGRRVLWRTDELLAWLDAGCPSRDDWKRLRSQQLHSAPARQQEVARE